MNPEDPELAPFTEALRDDLPSDADAARVRARLISAGLLAGAGALAPGLSAATSGGLLAKLGALPLAAKLGASAVVVGVAALPALLPSQPEATPRTESPRSTQSPKASSPVAFVARAPERAPASPSVPAAPARVAGPTPPTLRSPAVPPREALTPRPVSAAPGPSVASFPAAGEAKVDEGTLRAETLLMERALSALKRGDLTTARRELAAHAARFPTGHLKPERERAVQRLLEKENER